MLIECLWTPGTVLDTVRTLSQPSTSVGVTIPVLLVRKWKLREVKGPDRLFILGRKPMTGENI